MKEFIKELEESRILRHGSDICSKMKSATIGIAGLGGLGSTISLTLARMGIGKMVLVDYDFVEVSNIQRQQYDLTQLGLAKTEAMAQLIAKVHPTCETVLHPIRIDQKNAGALFADCDIVCEAFDDPYAKAMLVETLLSEYPMRDLVVASGMAGADSPNDIKTRHPLPHLYVCGDGVSDIDTTGHLFAARVAICANHQALTVLRLLQGVRQP